MIVLAQIVAGDEIESLFGAKLGLSTLAAAGLGNLISDVIGLGMAEPVQVMFSQICMLSENHMIPLFFCHELGLFTAI